MLLIGIDGGGSTTRARVACWDEETAKITHQADGTSGPSNLQTVPFARAVQHLEEAVSSAFRDLPQPRIAAAAACLGMAGCGRAEDAQRIEEWAARSGLADRIRIVNDAEPMLAELDPPGIGVALISGTGSFAWGRNSAGETRRCGGWGPIIGDEGSGYAIAVSALQAAARAADRGSPGTELLQAILASWNLTKPSQLIGKIYGDPLPRKELAALAPVVFGLAEHGDPSALQIVHEAATGLSEMVMAVATGLRLGPAVAVAAGGGCLLHQAILRDLVTAALQPTLPGSQITTVREPVSGAVQMARELAHRPS